MPRPTFPWFSSASQSRRRARELARNDYELLENLVRLRRDRGLSQAEVADLLGVTQQAISKIEQPGADPRLSTLRQYSHAIGALVKHVVAADEGQLQDNDRWVEISFTPTVSPTTTALDLRQFAVNAKRGQFALVA